MTHVATGSVVRQLGALFEGGSAAGLSDRQLVERYTAAAGDPDGEAAFAALVARHGPMVLGVCRQLLGDAQHAEDAFQAVFLVLARRARSIRDPDLLGNWLYGVAIRTARCSRQQIARRQRREEGDAMRGPGAGPGPGSCLPAGPTAPPADRPAIDREQADALHGEVDRLPKPFRLAVVLCYFEGLTLDEAAKRLRCPAGTLRSRLARAREKLRVALARRGVVLPAAALGALLAPRGASASVPPLLCDSTARAAIAFAAHHAAGGAPSALAREVLRTMLRHQWRATTLNLFLLASIAVGASYHALGAFAGPREGEPPGEPPAPTDPRPDDPTPPAPGRMTVIGRVLDPSGKPVPDATVMAYAALKQGGSSSDVARMMPAPIGRAQSDASGRFRLDAERTTSARHHDVGAVAMAPGFGAGWAELDPDADQPAAEIVLRPEQPIEGRLFDLTGRPVPGVRVEVHRMGRVVPPVPGGRARQSIEGPLLWWSHGRERPGWPAPATSDDQGRFTVRGLGRGIRVILGIDDPRFARVAADVDTDDVPGPKAVKIALEPARIIAGRVTDAQTGRPIPHAVLSVMSHKGGVGTLNPFEADDQGRFRANPLSADRYSIAVYPPPGQTYLNAGAAIFDWPKGAIEHRLDLALHRGAEIRGRVVEEGTDRPIAGARVGYVGRRTTDEATGAWNGSAESAPDGSFRVAVLPEPGSLVVMAPSDDYVSRSIDEGTAREGRPGGRRFFANAFVPCDLKPGAHGLDVTVQLRLGRTVAGRVVAPDGRPIPSASMISRAIVPPYPGVWRIWRAQYPGLVRDGRFEIHGLDPDAAVPVHFFEPKGGLGATAMLSGQSGADGPISIRLEPCGSARARLVDPAGQPVAGYPGFRLLSIVVMPGAFQSGPEPPQDVLALAGAASAIDPAHYSKGLVSDADGRITLPNLIPGAPYVLLARNRSNRVSDRKEFTVKPGETIDLGEIRAEKPAD